MAEELEQAQLLDKINFTIHQQNQLSQEANESQKEIKDIISKNEVLKSEVNFLQETAKGVGDANLKLFNEVTLVEMSRFRESVAINREQAQKNQNLNKEMSDNIGTINGLESNLEQVEEQLQKINQQMDDTRMRKDELNS